jgi:hemoglobin-like flavoprotein
MKQGEWMQQPQPQPPNDQPNEALLLIERRKDAVRRSWRVVRLGLLKDQAANIFYTRLFETYPTVRPLFKNDMNLQFKKLFRAVCLVVDGMDNLETLVPILHALGKAHAGFGTVRAHYDAVTECFLWMLNSILAPQMPKNSMVEVTEAWEWALTLIGGIMADGGDEAIKENHERGLLLAEPNGIKDEKVES